MSAHSRTLTLHSNFGENSCSQMTQFRCRPPPARLARPRAGRRRDAAVAGRAAPRGWPPQRRRQCRGRRVPDTAPHRASSALCRLADGVHRRLHDCGAVAGRDDPQQRTAAVAGRGGRRIRGVRSIQRQPCDAAAAARGKAGFGRRCRRWHDAGLAAAPAVTAAQVSDCKS